MKEETINKLLEKFIGYLETAEGFAIEQAPDFVQQLLAYYTWDAWFSFFLWFLTPLAPILMCVCALGCILYCIVKRDFSGTDEVFGTLIICLGVSFILSLPAANAYREVKKLELAPKVFLLEKAREVMR